MHSLEELRLLGELSEKGYFKETYDETKDDLVHKLTPKGIARIRKILEEPKYRIEFAKMIKEELKTIPQELRKGFILNVCKQLK